MKEKSRVSINQIMGLLTGAMIGSQIFFQGKILSAYYHYKTQDIDNSSLLAFFGVLGIVAFIITMKFFLNFQRKRLTMYFILSVIISMATVYILVIGSLVLLGRLLDYQEFQSFLSTELGQFIALNVSSVAFFVVVVCFVAIFALFVNRKVKYIQYISSEVKRLGKEGFGHIIRVEGNDELTDLSIGINAMSTALQEKIEVERQAEKDKNELITNVSHDLRTPLTSIIGYIALLKQNGFEDKDKFDQYLSVVDRRLNSLHMLINELFEYTRLTGSEQHLEYTQADMIAILLHLVSEYRILMEREGLQIETSMKVSQCLISVDVEKMVRVIQNLLDNARKYARKNSKVEIFAYEKEQKLYIQIQNQTDRLKKEEANRIFERFYKADPARSESESSGLGLSIARRIVELHHGTLECAFEDETISFMFWIPGKLSDYENGFQAVSEDHVNT